MGSHIGGTGPDADGDLSPAAALMLLEPNHCSGRAAVKVTLLSLFAQGHLRIEQRVAKGLLGTSWTMHIHVGSPVRDAPVHVASLLEIGRATERNDEGLRDLLQRAREEYGVGLANFKYRYILPELIERGLLTESTAKSLGVLDRQVFVHTPAGEIVRDRLKDKIQQAQAHPDLLKCGLAQVTMLVLAAGGNPTLLDALKPLERTLTGAIRGIDDFPYTMGGLNVP